MLTLPVLRPFSLCNELDELVVTNLPMFVGWANACLSQTTSDGTSLL